MKKIIKPILITICIVLVGLFLIKPTIKKISYGIDLQGGFEILYNIEPLNKDDKLTDDDLDKTYKAIVNRIDSLGVSEPVISFEGDNLIRIQLPGVSSEEEARQRISTTAVLSFRDVNDNLLMTSDILGHNGASLSQNSQTFQYQVKLDIKDTNTVYFEYANETNNPYAFLAVKKGSTWDVRYEADGTKTKVYELGNKIPTSTKELTAEKRGVIRIQPYHKYGVTVTIEGEDVFFKAEDKGEIAKEIPNLKDWGFKGNYFSSSWTEPSEGWAKFIETGTENEFSVEFVTTTENVEFGFLDTTGEWAAGGGFVIDELDKSFEGSVKSGGNSKINGLTTAKTYILTVTVKDSDGKATAKITAK